MKLRLKLVYLIITAAGVFSHSNRLSAASFTQGNIAVLQAEASANNTTASVIELGPNAAGQNPSNIIPIDGTTTPNSMRFSGSATSTGYLTNSADGSLLVFTGGNTTTSGATNINTILPRAVGTFNAAGTFNLAATYTGVSGNQARSATSLNNTTWFIADQGGMFSNGTSTASPSGNIRSAKAFGGVVYVFSGSTTLGSVSTIAAATGSSFVTLPGIALAIAANQDFYLISSGDNGAAMDVLYVLTATSNTAGIINKFSLVSGTWTANGSYTTSFGGFGLAAKDSGAGAELFVSSGQGALTANSVIKVTDTAGYNTAINIVTANNITLYTAPTGKIVKGVAFAPFAAVTPIITGTATAAAFTTTYGTASAVVQTFPVTGSNLSANITATAPAGFELSTDGTTFAGTASFASSNGSVNGTLSVRLSANAAVLGNLNSQNIALTSAGATTVNITTAASGNSVSAKALTVTANDVSKNLNVTLTGGSGSTAFTSSGLANSETIGSVTITYGAGGAAADPAGTYATSVVASLATGGSFTSSNYAITYMAGTITVNPAVSVSISGLTADNKAYDRTTSATLSGTPALVGVLPADVGNVSLSGTPVATFASSGFGNGIAVTVTGYTLSGSAAGSYALSQPTGLSANITQLALTVSGAAVTPKPFDGNTNATITGTLTSVISPDVVTFNGSGTFASSAIGTGIAVTSTSTIGGANAGNYVLTQLTGLTGDITAPTVTSVDLSNYIRVGRHNLPEYRRTALPVGTPVSNLLCDEASGVAYNWDTDTLFICGDGGRSITQVTKTGQLVDTMSLELNAGNPQGTEFYDPEGITYIGSGQFIFSEERERRIVKFTYAAGTTLTRANAQTVDLGTFDDNTGTEGLSWDPQTNGFIVLKEKTPIGVFQTGVDFALGTATNGSPTTVNSTNLFNTTLLGMTDVADVFALSNVPSMTGQPQAGNLLILGQENARVVNVDRAGNIVSTLNITSDVGNPLSAADQQHEGITMDRSGNIYIVNENGGGSIEFPQLWVYAPSTVPNQAPTALVINNSVNSIQENTSTLSPIKVGDIIVTDDGLGVNTFSLSGADAASFQITNASLFIKPGVVLDFETKASYAVTINVDDTTVGTTPDATLNYTLTVTDQIVEIPLPPALIVTEVAPWASSNGIVGGDWFEVTNVSANAVDITGWKIDDSSNAFATSLALTGITSIAAGESVIFLESTVANQATIVDTFKTVWFGGSPPLGLQVGTYQGSGAGLSTSGDAVNLFTAGGPRHSGVSFGAADLATPFQTFDNTAATNDTAIALLSTLGVNGAFVAATSAVEIGSPGISNPGVLRVTEVAPWSSGSSPVAADWFEVTNTGARAVDITGWKVDDNSESPAAALALVGITSIAPGESVIFLESATPVTTKTAFLSNWFGASPPATLQVGSYTGGAIGLSTGGDAVNLYDTNNVRQVNVSFGLSPSVAPFTSFDNAAGLNVAAITTFSSVGVNGAFIAANSANEIGSPGAMASAPIGASAVSIAAASIAEGNSGTTILNLPVTRTNTASVFTVNYAVTGGTATAGTDYATLAAGTLSFTFNGSASQNIAITINGDTTIESNETITVTLSGIVNANGTTTLGTAAASGTITNDDTVPVSFPSTARIAASVKGFIDLDLAPLSSTNGAEIPAFDPVSKRAFTSSNAGIQVINLTNPAAPAFITTIVPASLGVAGLTSNDVSSITVRKASGANPSVLAAGIISSPKSALGYVIFLNPATGALLGSTQVGANPDHIAFSPDGTKLLVANEGELDAVNAAPTVIASDTTVGSVSIISVPAAITGVPTSLPTTTADFTAYDSQAAALSAAGVRIFAGGKPSTDFEPEYFAISADSATAMITLQEANAVATLDIATATFTSVVPLGKKNFATGSHDFSDADGAGGARLINPTTGNPVYGLYMPDAVASYSASGQTYYITANEGDDRNDWLNPDETILLSNAAYDLDDTVFPNELALKANAALGKLTVCNSPGLRGDTNGDGDIDEILSYGGRSFSILNSAGAIIWDSGDMIENIVASQFPANFDDGRSDNKGPEPEGVTIATLGARTYAFIGLERSHMTLMFDVTNPAAVTFSGGLARSGDLNPEGLIVVSAADSPTGKPLLLQASEASQTLTVFELNQTTDYTLQLLHLADAEAGLLASQTAPNLAALVDAYDGTYVNTLILAGGDNYIPGPFAAAGTDALVAATHTRGNNPFAADIEIHNRIGVEASTVGNHEFDFGTNAFSDAILDTNFPYLSANLDFSGDAGISARYQETVGVGGLEEVTAVKNKVVPSAVVTKNGQKIGLVGATTQIIEGISSTGSVEVKGFVGDGSEMDNMILLASQIQPVINDLKNQGVNKIILMAHLQQIANEQALAPLLTDVDIILAAGSNTRLGDANDVAVAFTGHAANFANNYPIYTAGADRLPTVIVNTDNEFTYLGRLVTDFDADGVLIVPNLTANTALNGAYAATSANVATAWNVAEANLPTTAFAAGTKGALVKQITDAVQGVISVKDGAVRGYTSVYLEGERNFVRNQETNLGNISADSMVTVGKTSLPAATHVAALKNGGGIRAAIGAVDVASGAKLPPIANPGAGKPAGAVSLLDIENSMRFNNGLMLCDTTPAGLKAILEHGVASLGNQGRFPQIGGIRFSYTLTGTAGSRIQSIVTINDNGEITGRVVSGGVVRSDAPATITLVTLNFLAQGGDSYPFKANADNFRYLLTTGGLSAAIDESLNFTAVGVVPANILGEQAALSSHLMARYATPGTAYNLAETTPALDTRIQSTTVRTDTVLSGPATFAAWLAQNGFTGNAGGDTDSDGVPDSLEYFFNSNPNDGGDRDNLPTVIMNGNDLEFRFAYLSSTVFTGFLQCSEDLINWANATPGVDYEVITETLNGVETAVRYRIFCSPLPTTQGPFSYLSPFTASVGRGAIDQLTITNHGMVGAGRISGEALDSFGETQGAASGLSITGWGYNSGSGQFSGTFNVLPDRGYNSGAIYSNYAARIHTVPFTFTPYYGAGAVAQGQIVPTYGSTTKFTYLDGVTTKFTTGLNPTGISTIMSQSVGTVTAANGPGGAQTSMISFDAEAIHVFPDGSGFVSDEYGTYICRFNSSKQFTRIIQLPVAAQPHSASGVRNFTSTTPAPVSGRRVNQGLEGMAVSPDNKRLMALLQSATVQDTNGAQQQTRYNARLFVYDIEGANLENPVLIGEYVVQLPRFDSDANGSLDATAAQSEIVALSNTQFLILPRDGNGLGRGTAAPIVTKTVDLVDFGSATNVLGLHDSEGNQISPLGVLRAGITPARSTVVINLLSSTDLTKFGFNTNTTTPNQFTVAEKIEGMSLVPDTSTASTEDYFLFVANDNDFQSSNVQMLDTTGAIVSYGDARSSVSGSPKITNDAVFTAWRITICPNNRKFFRINLPGAP